MTAVPWFKFFAADYLTDADVDNLSLEAQAILIRMWSVHWLEGSLPGDLRELARKCKILPATMQKHADQLLKFFVRQPDGTYVSERMEKERQRSGIVSKRRSEAANKRWTKRSNAIAPAKANARGHARNGAIGDPVRRQKSDLKFLPPTPLSEGGYLIWERVKRLLKDELSTAYVFNGHFDEVGYDKYFRDAVLMGINDRKVLLSHPNPGLLREGIQKFHKRLETIFTSCGINQVELQVFEGPPEPSASATNLKNFKHENSRAVIHEPTQQLAEIRHGAYLTEL